MLCDGGCFSGVVSVLSAMRRPAGQAGKESNPYEHVKRSETSVAARRNTRAETATEETVQQGLELNTAQLHSKAKTMCHQSVAHSTCFAVEGSSYQDGVCSIMSDFVIGCITIWQAQVIVLNLQIHKWQDELQQQGQPEVSA